MVYTPTTWADTPSTTTPINAARLNKIEAGVDQAHDHIDDTSDAHDASAISFVPAGEITTGATNVQSALGNVEAYLLFLRYGTFTPEFIEAIQDIVAGMIVAGSNVTKTYNDASNTITIAATGGGSSGTITGYNPIYALVYEA